MSIEYRTELPQGYTVNLNDFAGWNGRASFFEILSVNPVRLSLRWSDQPPRVDWPEDADISVDGPSIWVSIHSGAQAKRVQLLDALSRWLNEKLQSSQAFEEV